MNKAKTIGELLNKSCNNTFFEGLNKSYGLGLGYNAAEAPMTLMRESSKVTQIWTDNKNKLEIKADYIIHIGYDAVSCSGSIKNTGDTASGKISEVIMLDLQFSMDDIGFATIHGAGGGNDMRFYPPDTYKRYDISLVKPYWWSLSLGSENGLSSNKTMPFFVISDEKESGGIYIGLGWSGNWKIDFSTSEEDDGKRLFIIKAYMSEVDLMLYPGEEIPVPEVLLGVYEGDYQTGMNCLRKVLLDKFTPKLKTYKEMSPIGYGTWFANGGLGGAERLTEDNLKKQVDLAKEIGCEFFEIDLGWEKGSCDLKDFNNRVMDWEPELTKFPSGFNSFVDYVKSSELDFGLWLDIARTTPTSQVAIDHPDWILWQGEGGTTSGMVNFGLEEVRVWAKSVVRRMVEEYRINWIRADYNIDPVKHWGRYDEPDRNGITEIRHIEGYNEFLDYLLAEFPDLCVEQCAAGGRMLDLATAKRGHMLFLSDMTGDPDICRFQLSGAGCFLPSSAIDRNVADWSKEYSPLNFLSRFGGGLGVSDNILSWPPESLQLAKHMISIYKNIRKYLKGDYYPIFSQPLSIKEWDGWQYCLNNGNEGIMIAFRAKSPDEKKTIILRCISRHYNYQFTNLISNEKIEISGNDLTHKGFEVYLDYDGAGIWEYKSAF